MLSPSGVLYTGSLGKGTQEIIFLWGGQKVLQVHHGIETLKKKGVKSDLYGKDFFLKKHFCSLVAIQYLLAIEF